AWYGGVARRWLPYLGPATAPHGVGKEVPRPEVVEAKCLQRAASCYRSASASAFVATVRCGRAALPHRCLCRTWRSALALGRRFRLHPGTSAPPAASIPVTSHSASRMMTVEPGARSTRAAQVDVNQMLR